MSDPWDPSLKKSTDASFLRELREFCSRYSALKPPPRPTWPECFGWRLHRLHRDQITRLLLIGRGGQMM